VKTKGWDTVVLSEPSHEHLVAEMYFDGELIAQLDREDGRESICISLVLPSSQPAQRIRLEEFLQACKSAAEDLAR
jgi:hypothetical protein